jgi:hypothetical protein
VSDYGDNIWGELEELGDGVSGKRLVRSPDSHLVAAVWELQAGAEPGPYHLHHGTDEYLLVLRGTRPRVSASSPRAKRCSSPAVWPGHTS